MRNKIRELKVANRKEIRSKHQIISKKRGTNVSTALAVSIHGGISRTREMWNEILKIGPSPTKNQGKAVWNQTKGSINCDIYINSRWLGLQVYPVMCC